MNFQFKGKVPCVSSPPPPAVSTGALTVCEPAPVLNYPPSAVYPEISLLTTWPRIPKVKGGTFLKQSWHLSLKMKSQKSSQILSPTVSIQPTRAHTWLHKSLQVTLETGAPGSDTDADGTWKMFYSQMKSQHASFATSQQGMAHNI